MLTAMKKFNQPCHLLRLFLLILIITQVPFSHCCHDQERNALLTFKSFLTDPSNRLLSWQVGTDCCHWQGIHCSNDSFHVVSVDLGNPDPREFMDELLRRDFIIPSSTSIKSALNGAIAPSLFYLSHLEYLNLRYNNFNFSEIPFQFANLKHLTHLDLSHSMFSGFITAQFANLSSLKYLYLSCLYDGLSSCYVTSTDISWLRGLVNLRDLRLRGVDLSSAASYSPLKNWAEPISYLADLRRLDLSDCNISAQVPINELLNLSRLSSLKMNNNFLNSPIPIKLVNFTSLSALQLSNCQLQASSLPYLPSQLEVLDVSDNPDLGINLISLISNVSLLNYLDASNCSIQGSLPISITNLSQLEYLYLHRNNITGQIPSSMSKNLKVLSLSRNNLQGSIPDSICEISSLAFLDLGANNLSGTIPSCISKLQILKTLDVSKNSIEGTFSLISFINKLNLAQIILNSNRISVEIDQYYQLLPSKLQQLDTLGLESCNLKGYIPTFLCDSTNLFNLNLNGNNLTGSIPYCLFYLPNLVYLDLGRNNLQGMVPHSFPYFRGLDLSSNNLRGPLPLPPKTYCDMFDLSNNKFTGGISIEIGKRLSKVKFVYLSYNQLSGSIPSFICSKVIKNILRHLDLSNNQLSGTIPPSLLFCNSLISLNLGANNLSGNIPNELGQAKNLKYLQLHRNFLNGTFPSFIQQLQYLQVLNLGNNRLKGRIPSFIGSLHSLKILSLRSNMFSGLIPKEIVHLGELQILDLSINNLSGQIPTKVGNLKMLTSRSNNTSLQIGHDIVLMKHLGVELQMVTKGGMRNLERLYSYSSGIDLSCNILDGNIPKEMGLLKELVMLNLSHNRFSGKIPANIGNMVSLESMDLSFNKLSGDIPESLASIDFLGYLNLSYNNLSGKIPKGHLETLSGDNGSTYFGNYWLCGPPTNKSCHVEASLQEDDHAGEDGEDEDASEKWLFFGIVFLGFGVGFWGLFLVLLIKKEKWWFGYWRAVDNIAVRMVECIR